MKVTNFIKMSLSSEIQINKIEFVFETCITQSLRKVKA